MIYEGILYVPDLGGNLDFFNPLVRPFPDAAQLVWCVCVDSQRDDVLAEKQLREDSGAL